MLILLILMAPYIFRLTSNLISGYNLRNRIKAEQRAKEAEELKEKNIAQKIYNLIQSSNIKTLTTSGWLNSLNRYLDAKRSVSEYFKDYGLSCEDLANGVRYKSNSTYFNIDHSEFTRDFIIKDCQSIKDTKDIYEQYIVDKDLINKFMSENRNSNDLDIKDYVRTLSINLTSIDLKIKLLN